MYGAQVLCTAVVRVGVGVPWARLHRFLVQCVYRNRSVGLVLIVMNVSPMILRRGATDCSVSRHAMYTKHVEKGSNAAATLRTVLTYRFDATK